MVNQKRQFLWAIKASTRKEWQGALSEYHEVMACFYLNDEQKAHIF